MPYKGSGPAIQDVIGGQVDMMFDTTVVAGPHIQSGKLRAIAVTSAKRLASMPRRADGGRVGRAGAGRTSRWCPWQAIFVPAGTPAPIVDRLHNEIRKILAQPEMQDKLKGFGMEPADMTTAQIAAFQKAEVDKWAQVIKAANIKAGVGRREVSSCEMRGRALDRIAYRFPGMSHLSDRLPVLPQYLFPKQALTSFAGWVAGKERGRGDDLDHPPLRRPSTTSTWARRSTATSRATASFNEFFTRALKPGARPIAAGRPGVARWMARISQFGAHRGRPDLPGQGPQLLAPPPWSAATRRWRRSSSTAASPRST